jgi:hypothetical protein
MDKPTHGAVQIDNGRGEQVDVILIPMLMVA